MAPLSLSGRGEHKYKLVLTSQAGDALPSRLVRVGTALTHFRVAVNVVLKPVEGLGPRAEPAGELGHELLLLSVFAPWRGLSTLNPLEERL